MQRSTTVFALAVVAIAAGLLAMPAGAGQGSDVRSKPFAFTATTLPVPAGFSAFSEPSVALNSKDHVYFCGPLGLSDGNSTEVLRGEVKESQEVIVGLVGGAGRGGSQPSQQPGAPRLRL